MIIIIIIIIIINDNNENNDNNSSDNNIINNNNNNNSNNNNNNNNTTKNFRIFKMVKNEVLGRIGNFGGYGSICLGLEINLATFSKWSKMSFWPNLAELGILADTAQFVSVRGLEINLAGSAKFLPQNFKK